MKINYSFDCDGWLNIKLEAETAQDAANLVRLGMNRNAEAGKVASFFTTTSTVCAHIMLRTRRDNMGCCSINNTIKPV